MAIETNPNYAANEAWSLAASMMRGLLTYLDDPSGPLDHAADLIELAAEGKQVAGELNASRALMTGEATTLPDPKLLSVIERCVDYEVDVVIATEIKRHGNPEPAKWRIVQLLATANR